MAHMQENPQNAGKDTRMPAAGETRQMPLRADRPVQTAQAPYPLQGRPAPTQRVVAPFLVRVLCQVRMARPAGTGRLRQVVRMSRAVHLR